MLQAKTGVSDIDEIVNLFSKYEQDNLSLFQLVTEITEDVFISSFNHNSNSNYINIERRIRKGIRRNSETN